VPRSFKNGRTKPAQTRTKQMNGTKMQTKMSDFKLSRQSLIQTAIDISAVVRTSGRRWASQHTLSFLLCLLPTFYASFSRLNGRVRRSVAQQTTAAQTETPTYLLRRPSDPPTDADSTYTLCGNALAASSVHSAQQFEEHALWHLPINSLYFSTVSFVFVSNSTVRFP